MQRISRAVHENVNVNARFSIIRPIYHHTDVVTSLIAQESRFDLFASL